MLINTSYCLPFDFSHASEYEVVWYLIVILIYISQMINYIKYLSVCLLIIKRYPLRNLLPIVKLGYFSFCWSWQFFINSSTNPLLNIWSQIFSPILLGCLHFLDGILWSAKSFFFLFLIMSNSLFSFVTCAFNILCNRPLLIKGLNVLLCWLLRIFVALPFIFRSMIHMELIFLYSMRDSNFILLYEDIVVLVPFLRKLYLLPLNILDPFLKINWPWV